MHRQTPLAIKRNKAKSRKQLPSRLGSQKISSLRRGADDRVIIQDGKVPQIGPAGLP